MPSPLPRGAEHRRLYRLHSLVGLALALVLVLVVFTVPVVAGEPDVQPLVQEVPVVLEDVPPTDLQTPPPPPPPAPPPPAEVPDEAQIEEAIVDEVVLDLREAVVPPAPPAIPQPIRPPEPPAPPPPPTVDPVDEIVEFLPLEDAPKLIGGLEGLQARVRYPEMARRAQIQGVVYLQFVVDEEGRVVDPTVARSPSPLLSDAALEALEEARFVPGHQRGRPVKVRYSLPVRFVLR